MKVIFGFEIELVHFSLFYKVDESRCISTI